MCVFRGKRGVLIALIVWFMIVGLIWLVPFPYPVCIVFIVLAYLCMAIAAFLFWRML
jgi:hypothetical protein